MPGRSFFLCTEREVSPRRRRERTSQTRARRRPAAAAGCGTTMTPAIVAVAPNRPSRSNSSRQREKGEGRTCLRRTATPLSGHAPAALLSSSWAGEPPGPAGPDATDCCCRRRPAAAVHRVGARQSTLGSPVPRYCGCRCSFISRPAPRQTNRCEQTATAFAWRVASPNLWLARFGLANPRESPLRRTDAGCMVAIVDWGGAPSDGTCRINLTSIVFLERGTPTHGRWVKSLSPFRTCTQ
jgi:hypothetical protein